MFKNTVSKIKTMYVNILWNINYNIREYITAPYYKVKVGITNLFLYFNVIWNDRWWDYSFALTLLKRKIDIMESQWDKSIYVDSEKDKKDLQKISKLLESLIEEDFDFSKEGIKKKQFVQLQLLNKLRRYENFWD